MLKDKIKCTFKTAEPILLEELFAIEPGKNENAVRQEIYRMTRTGDLMRFDYGVYFIPGETVIGTVYEPSVEESLEKKYIKKAPLVILQELIQSGSWA